MCICVKKMIMKPKYKIEFLDEAVEFLNELNDKVREKIYYNLKKSQISNDKTLFKKLNDEIWEYRTLYKRTVTIQRTKIH